MSVFPIKRRKLLEEDLMNASEKEFLEQSFEKTNHREFIVRASNVIWIKLISAPEDFDNDAIAFHPKFTHQLFEKEVIKGYKNLRINIYFTAASLAAYLNITYDKKHPSPFVPDDIESRIKKFMNGGYFTTKKEFLETLRQEKGFIPFGETIQKYRRISKNCAATHTNVEPDFNVHYELKLNTFKTTGFKELHDRMQFLLLFFIDASSYIDSSDSIWKILCLFECKILNNSFSPTKTKMRRNHNLKSISKTSNNNQTNTVLTSFHSGTTKPALKYTFVGYCTLYTFFCFPQSNKLRISQILVLPPFQRQGHGCQFLAAISGIAHKENYSEINVEDPSDGFQFLRDLTDVCNCIRGGYFEYLAEENFLQPLRPTAFQAIKSDLKITDVQIERCFEVVKLRFLDLNNEAMYKGYRLQVKRRLFRIFWEELSVLEGESRKQRLNDLYFDTEKKYSLLLLKIKQPPRHIFEMI